MTPFSPREVLMSLNTLTISRFDPSVFTKSIKDMSWSTLNVWTKNPNFCCDAYREGEMSSSFAESPGEMAGASPWNYAVNLVLLS
jgi:hypothetical protein